MNLTTIFTADETLKATQDDYEALEALLEESDYISGFEIEYCAEDEELFLFAHDGLEYDLPEAFLLRFGDLIKKNGKKYLGFGYANVANRLGPNTHSGSRFRIYADGTLNHPTLVWDED